MFSRNKILSLACIGHYDCVMMSSPRRTLRRSSSFLHFLLFFIFLLPFLCADEGDLCVNRVIFLLSRTSAKDSASLVSSGPRNMIHFWSVFSSGQLYARFVGVSANEEMPNIQYCDTLQSVIIVE